MDFVIPLPKTITEYPLNRNKSITQNEKNKPRGKHSHSVKKYISQSGSLNETFRSIAYSISIVSGLTLGDYTTSIPSNTIPNNKRNHRFHPRSLESPQSFIVRDDFGIVRAKYG